ncbi:MAG: hypothetical protein AAB855_02545, partial [Patescibacteria group bacterium]
PEFYDPDLQVGFRYHRNLVGERAYDEKDAADKIVYRIKNGEREDAPILVTVKWENGLRKVSSILRYDILDILLDNADKRFTKQYIKYEKKNERKFEREGRKAAEIEFEYLSPLGAFIRQRMTILMRDEDTAVYIAAQTRKESYDAVNKKYFEQIFSTVGFKDKYKK